MLPKELPDLEEVEMNSEHGVDVDELIEMNNNLMCCGNCFTYLGGICVKKGQFKTNIFVCDYCSDWQPDGLTREERIKG